MKALKLKSSTKENPIWGTIVWYVFLKRFSDIKETVLPILFNDDTDISSFINSTPYENLESVDAWELVTVKITIE